MEKKTNIPLICLLCSNLFLKHPINFLCNHSFCRNAFLTSSSKLLWKTAKSSSFFTKNARKLCFFDSITQI